MTWLESSGVVPFGTLYLSGRLSARLTSRADYSFAFLQHLLFYLTSERPNDWRQVLIDLNMAGFRYLLSFSKIRRNSALPKSNLWIEKLRQLIARLSAT